MNEPGAIGTAIVSIIMAVVGVAIIATLVSSQAQTANVLTAGGTAIQKVLGAALSPVTGGTGSNIFNTGLNLFGTGGGITLA